MRPVLSVVAVATTAMALSTSAEVEFSKGGKEAMQKTMTAVINNDHLSVLEMSAAPWRARFKELGNSSLGDLAVDVMETDKIEILYGEGIKANGVEYRVYSCSVTTKEHNPTKYMISMVWLKEGDGWRFLNLPFKDFALPPELSILTAHAGGASTKTETERPNQPVQRTGASARR